MSVSKIKLKKKLNEKQRKNKEMSSAISSLVRIWKISHSYPVCSFVWKIRVVYFSVKHSYLCNKKRYQVLSATVTATEIESTKKTKRIDSWVRYCCRFWFVYKTNKKNSTKVKEFSRSKRKLSVFPGVFQGPGRKFQNSRSFSGIPGIVSTMLWKI